jgi:hypothetical protein
LKTGIGEDSGDLSIELVGERRALRALSEPAVDPKGERMRS